MSGRVFSDAEVFGPAPAAAPSGAVLSDEDVFGPAPPPVKTRNPLEGARAGMYDLGAKLTRALAGVSGDVGEFVQRTIPSNLTSGTPMLDLAAHLEQAAADVGYAPRISGERTKEAIYAPATSLPEFGRNLRDAGTFALDSAVSSLPHMAGAVLAPEALVAARTEQIATERAKNDGRAEVTGADRMNALPAAAIEVFGERFASRFIPGLGGGTLAGTAPVRAVKQLGLQTGTEGVQGAAAYAGETAGTEKGLDPIALREAAILEALAGAPVAGVAGGLEIGAEALANRGFRTDPEGRVAEIDVVGGTPSVPAPTVDPRQDGSAPAADPAAEVLAALAEAREAMAAAQPAPVEAAPAAVQAPPVQPAPEAAPVPAEAPARPLADVLAMPEDDYIAAVNPEGKRLAEDDRMRLLPGDIEAPADAAPVATVKDKQGADVRLLRDPAGTLYAEVDGQVVGFMGPSEPDSAETVNEVVDGYQGRGIGTALATEYLRTNPLAPSGGFSEGGERTRRAAFRALQAEQAPATATETAPAAPQPPREVVLALRQEIGWDERGGRLLRAEGGEGDVTGRTQWIGKRGRDGKESQFWRQRPVKLNEAQANTAFDKWERGEPLTKPEQAFIDYAIRAAAADEQARAADAADAAAYEAWLASQLPEAEQGDNRAGVNEVAGLVEQARAAGLDEFDIAPFDFESDVEYADRLRAMLEPNDDSADPFAAEAGEGDLLRQPEGAVAPGAAEQPAPVAQGALLPPPTVADQVGAAQRAKDEARNRGTRADTGDGGLFDGPRPAQVDIEDAAPPAEPSTTSTKNEATERQRAERGLPPVPASGEIDNETAIADAQARLAANPALGPEVVARLQNAGAEGISHADEALLQVYLRDVMNRRNAAAERAADPAADEDARALAKQDFDALELTLAEIEQAARAGGSEWGRMGQLRQRELAEDFSLAALERKRRALNGGPLTEADVKELRETAERLAALQAKHEQTVRALEEARSGAAVTNIIRSLEESLANKPKPRLESLKAAADAARARIAATPEVVDVRGQAGAVINPTIFLDYSIIGAYHVANKVTQFTDWVAAMAAEFAAFAKLGDADQRAIFKNAKVIARTDAKQVQTPDAVMASIDPEKGPTHNDVAKLALAHIRSGVRGEKPIMAAVHADLTARFPDLTERDVRRLLSDYGKATFPSRDEDLKALRELRALTQLQESIDRLEEGLPALKSGLQRDKATQAIREKRQRLNDLLKQAAATQGLSPERLASYQQARITNLKNQIADLQKQLAGGEKPARTPAPAPDAETQRLINERDALRAQLDALKEAANPKPTPEQRYQQARAKSIASQLQEVRERLAKGDYERRARPEPKRLSEANERAAFELAKAKAEFARRQFDLEMSRRHPVRKALGTVAETFNVARAIMTSVDLSGLLRQGGFITYGHPVRAAQSIVPMLQAFASEKKAFAVDEEIANRPNARLYKRAGLQLTEHNNHLPSKMEEAFMSRWIDRLPTALGGGIVRGSARAYTVLLNRLRADSFDAMYASLTRGGDVSDAEIKAIGNYINVATGRGKIGSRNQAAVGLNTVFFAPKLVASRFNLLFGQPLYGGSNRTRALIAQDYARFMVGVGTVFALAYMAQDDDERLIDLDPRSTNFLKIRFGNTFIDPMTGLSQVTVFVAREATGEKVTGKGKEAPLRERYRILNWLRATPKTDKPKFGGDTGVDILMRFLRTKLAPVPGAIVDNLAGENVVGEPTSIEHSALNLATPMSLRDVHKIMEDNGVPKGSAIFLANILGMSVQYRDPHKKTDEAERQR